MEREMDEKEEQIAKALAVIENEDAPIEEVISSLIEGSPIFQCRGTARVKVGAKVIQIPIRSVDMEQIVKTLAHKRPKAPTERMCIKADSTEGRKMGLKRDRWVIVSIESDEAYQEQLQKYNAELGYLIILNGLDTKISTKDGKLVWEPDNPVNQNKDEALRVLRGMGLTGWQFTQISDAIRDLTKFEEEEVEKNSEEE